MRIVTKDEFMKLPAGTVFCNTQPCIFIGLMVKGENVDYPGSIDHWEADIIHQIDSRSSEDADDIYFSAMNDGVPFRLAVDIESREGMFDPGALYAVYEREDVEKLITRLQGCLDSGYSRWRDG